MPKNINVTNAGVAIVDSMGRPTQAFFRFMQLVSDLEILDGTGSPEGVLDRKIKTLYLDTAAGVLYIKTTNFGASTGWVALN